MNFISQKNFFVTTAFCFGLISSINFAQSADVPGAPEEEACAAERDWIDARTAPLNQEPADPTENECGFYQWAVQTFLYITKKGDDDQKERFLKYPTMAEVFNNAKIAMFRVSPESDVSLAPRIPKQRDPVIDKSIMVLNDALAREGIKQAGSLEGVLVDQRKHIIYYSIQMNDIFQKFVVDNKLNASPESLINFAMDNPQTVFPRGALELKSSWAIADGSFDLSKFISAKARLPKIKNVDGTLIADPDDLTDEKDIVLVGLHVVGVIENHPEFIWATFEHEDAAVSAEKNPKDLSDDDLSHSISRTSLLYDGKTPLKDSNKPVPSFTLGSADGLQTLEPPTPVYRAFPGSAVDETDEDEDVVGLNSSLADLFGQSTDVRSHYNLVGAVWLKNGAKDFSVDSRFGDNPEFGEIDALLGEQRMSNISMESFTQNVDREHGCFSCHTTKAVAGIPAARINVSHILSKFVIDSGN